MRLAAFISSNIENILSDWVVFARTKISVGQGMTDLALRDDAAAILLEVARDMVTTQSSDEQLAKSQGDGVPGDSLTAPPSRAHAMQRVRSGFEVNQMVAEFRALRATVLRLWSESAGKASIEDLNDVTRFNEAIDQALAESLKYFVSEVDRARNLFMGVLGHDLRTPLSTIFTYSSILKLRRPDDAREVEMIQRSSDAPISIVLGGDEPEGIVLQVQNFGQPIAANLIADIFEPLVRGSNPAGPAQVGGANMGLGLYIAREVASAHYGTIQVTSDAECGTVFEVCLPRTPPEIGDTVH